MTIIGLVIIAYSSMIFCGCAKETPQQIVTTSENSQVVREVEVPVVSENKYQCIVDEYGYTNDEEKKVLFNGMQEGQSFWVIDSDTSKAVYEGKVSADMGHGVTGVGDFSEITVSGNYYIYTKECGSSQNFGIKENISNERAQELYEQFILEECDEVTAKSLMFAFMAYDLNRNNMKLIDDLSVTIRNYLEETEISNEDALSIGMVYAGFYCVGQRDCPDLARKCIANAKKIYQALEDDKKVTESWDWYIFNTWMLRATGDSVYKDVAEAFINDEEKVQTPDRFIGDYGYLKATKNVDSSVGYKLISPIMDEAADTVEKTKNSSYLSILDEDMEGSLLKLTKLTYVNYVITNKEYRTAIRNNLHYLFGRNEDSKNYLVSDDSCLCGDDGLYYKSMILFVLSNVDFVLDTGKQLLD